MAHCSNADGARLSLANHLDRMLNDYNDFVTKNDEKLTPTAHWSEKIIEKLRLKDFAGLAKVKPNDAVAALLPAEMDQSIQSSLRKFFECCVREEMNNYFRQEIDSQLGFLIEALNAEETPSEHQRSSPLVGILLEFEIFSTERSERSEFEAHLKQLTKADQFRDLIKTKSKATICSDISMYNLLTDLLNLCPTILPISKDLVDLLKKTKLDKYLFHKVGTTELTEIRYDKHSESLKQEPALKMLRELAACNYRARDDTNNDSSSQRMAVGSFASLLAKAAKDESFHPIDILHAGFLCCNAEAKQFLCQRLFACKLAFPFLYYNEFDQQVQCDWALKSICLEYEDREGHLVEVNLGTEEKLPAVSFMRIGEIDISKSRVVNHLLSSEQHNTFFNRDCKGGKNKRACSNGLVEAAVGLPSAKMTKVEVAFLALNLRGDSRSFEMQRDGLVKLSHVCVMFISITEFNEYAKETVRKVNESVENVIAVFSAPNGILEKCGNVQVAEASQMCQDLSIEAVATFDGDGQLPLDDVCAEICSKLNSYLSKPHNDKKIELHDDMDISEKEALSFSKSLLDFLKGNHFNHEIVFRVQKDMNNWRQISELERKGFSASGCRVNAEKELKKIYQSLANEFCFLPELANIVVGHIKYLLRDKSSKRSIKIYLQQIKISLEIENRKTLPALKREHSEAKRSLDSCSSPDDQERRKQTEQVMDAEKKLTEASIDVNVMFRDIGLLYEAHAQANLPNMSDAVRELPEIFANLLMSEIALELVDGRVRSIPLKWISAVLRECQKMVGKTKKLFVVSVLGTQSTGKSTLLNTMFGLTFPVSASRCTRGAFLQLVPVNESSRLPFHYLAVIDTEGLRAIELGSKNYIHDNELATLAIGLSDLTIITMSGEDSPEMRHVLEIVTHAFINMKSVNKELCLKRKCIFVHQNVSDATASERLKKDISTRQSMLDEIAKTAAEEKSIGDVKSFSDLISFSPDKDSYFMPSLWFGNPPMAPVNVQYAEKVKTIKEHIVDYALQAQNERSFISLSDLATRIKDIWTAVLSENFVYAFRNTIELKAYRLLEEEVAQLKAECGTRLEEYIAEIRKEVKLCIEVDEVDNKGRNLPGRLSKKVDTFFKDARRELQRHFENGEYKEYTVQWKAGKLASLDSAKEEKKRQLDKKLQEIIAIQKKDIENDEFVQDKKAELLEAASDIAREKDCSKLEDAALRKEFEKRWKGILDKIEETEVSDSKIKEELKNGLLEVFEDSCKLINDQLGKTPMDSPVPDLSNVKDWYAELFGSGEKSQGRKDKQSGKNEIFRDIRDNISRIFSSEQSDELEEINLILKSVATFLSRTEKEERDFRSSDAQSVVSHVRDKIFASTRLSKPIKEMPELSVAVAVFACRMAYKTFVGMNEKFLRQHSVKYKLKNSKDHHLSLFMSHAQNTSTKAAAVTEIKAVLRTALWGMLNTNMKLNLKQKYLPHYEFANKKLLLIKLLLKEAIENPRLARKYISYPKTAALEFISLKSEQILLQASEPYNKCAYQISVEEILERPCKTLTRAIQVASASKGADEFSSDCSKAGIPLEMNRLKSAVNDAEWDSAGLKDIEAGIKDTKDSLLEKIKNMIREKSVDLPGIQGLNASILDDLWGCESGCPLCNEPCIMGADHANSQSKITHCCVVHRPMGLTGKLLRLNSELAKYTCNYFATAMCTPLQGSKRIFGAQKKFRCADCAVRQKHCSGSGFVYHECYDYKRYFPDWDIDPNFQSTVPDLWKRLATSCRESLVQTSDVYKRIPEKWKHVSKEEAHCSLDEIFKDSECDNASQGRTTSCSKSAPPSSDVVVLQCLTHLEPSKRGKLKETLC